jgi:hypothetical protein
MNEKSFATDPRGFMPIPQVWIFKGMRTDFLEERPGRMEPAPTAKRRQNTAHGTGETMSHRRALLYEPANTGSTLGLHPANFSRRNERATPCI